MSTINAPNNYTGNSGIFPRYGLASSDPISLAEQRQLLTIYHELETSNTSGNTTTTKYDIVRLPLQDNLGTLGVKSNWESIAKSGALELIGQAASVISSGIGDLVGATGEKIFNFAYRAGEFSMKANNAQSYSTTYSQLYWNGSAYDPLSYDFVLIAVEDALTDVINPLKSIMSWGSPINSKTAFGDKSVVAKMGNVAGQAMQAVNELLTGNGGEFIRSPPKVAITVGRFLHIPQVAISDFSVVFSNNLDDQGYPISAKGRITFKIPAPPSQASINALFNVKETLE